MICELNIDIAIAAIRTAFNPLSCSIGVCAYQRQIRFQVFGLDDKDVLCTFSISMRDIIDRSILSTELHRVRALLKQKGFRLNAWTVPSWPTYRAYRRNLVSPGTSAPDSSFRTPWT
jgi:hypothetical protein